MKSKRPFDVLSDGLVTESGREILKQSQNAADAVMSEVFYNDTLPAITYILELADCIMDINMEDALGLMMHKAEDEDERSEIIHLSKRLAAVMAIAFNIKVRYQSYIEDKTGKNASELHNAMQVEKLANDIETTSADELEMDDILKLALGGLPKDILKQLRDSMNDDSDDREYD